MRLSRLKLNEFVSIQRWGQYKAYGWTGSLGLWFLSAAGWWPSCSSAHCHERTDSSQERSHYRVSDWLRDMSVEVEEDRKSDPKRICARQFWRLFPHVFLILSLILYAFLGAQIFQQIENRTYNEKRTYNKSGQIDALVRKVLETVQNHSGLSLSL